MGEWLKVSEAVPVTHFVKAKAESLDYLVSDEVIVRTSDGDVDIAVFKVDIFLGVEKQKWMSKDLKRVIHGVVEWMPRKTGRSNGGWIDVSVAVPTRVEMEFDQNKGECEHYDSWLWGLDDVIVCFADGEVSLGKYYRSIMIEDEFTGKEYFSTDINGMESKFDSQDVVAWRPLPRPYEGGRA